MGLVCKTLGMGGIVVCTLYGGQSAAFVSSTLSIVSVPISMPFSQALEIVSSYLLSFVFRLPICAQTAAEIVKLPHQLQSITEIF